MNTSFRYQVTRLLEDILQRPARDHLRDAGHLAAGDKALARLSLTLAMHARRFGR